MQGYKKHTITIRGRVQEVGFRGYLEDLCKRLRIPSIVYNTAADELKLLCEADQDTVVKLSAQIREYRLGEIRDLEIKEGLELPFPPYRAVLGIEQEIYNRLDDGVKILYLIKEDTKILGSIKEDTKKVDESIKILGSIKEDTTKLNKKLNKLDDMDEKLGDVSETLREISKKL